MKRESESSAADDDLAVSLSKRPFAREESSTAGSSPSLNRQTTVTTPTEWGSSQLDAPGLDAVSAARRSPKGKGKAIDDVKEENRGRWKSCRRVDRAHCIMLLVT